MSSRRKLKNSDYIGVSLEDKLIIDASKDERIKKLKNLMWGLGIEHEVQIFHEPKPKNKIVDFILFNSEPVRDKLYYSDQLSLFQREMLSKIPFEKTGRMCSSKVVIKQTPILMPEFITTKPFSSYTPGNRKVDKSIKEGIDVVYRRTVESYVAEVIKYQYEYIKLIEVSDEFISRLIEKYGDLMEYPFGMTSYLKYPKKYTINYSFEKDKKNDKVHQDYLGSYHITITLPFDENTKLKQFIKNHQNLACQIQWIEPLLVAAFFSCDQRAIGTQDVRVKGSWRVTRIGWGNFAGTDVRKLDKGTGRMGNIPTYWREDFNFHGAKITQLCKPVTPSMQEKEPSAVTTYSSNFRTFGSTDPKRPMHRESGLGMTKPNGIEIRIFDHFNIRYLKSLAQTVIYIAENSKMSPPTEYVYKNKAWIDTVKNVMINGWLAMLDSSYIATLRKQLGIPIKTKSRRAYDVLLQVMKEIQHKTKKGDWVFLMLSDPNNPDPLPEINRKSIEMAIYLKFNRDDSLLNKFNNMLKDLKPKKYSYDEFTNIFFNHFNYNDWSNDVNHIIMLMTKLYAIVVKDNDEGEIETIIVKEKLKELNNKIINAHILQLTNENFDEEENAELNRYIKIHKTNK